MGYDYYYIVWHKRGGIEVVHPKQRRNSDEVIHTISKEEWNDFMLLSKINPLLSKSVDDYWPTYYIYKSMREQHEIL